MRVAETTAYYVAQYMQKGGGDYVEIGTRRGLSLVAAGPYAWSLTAIDPMQSLGARPGYAIDELGDEIKFWLTVRKAGFQDKTTLIVKSSYPWPNVLYHQTWNVALIDGEHTGFAVANDLVNLAARTRHYIIVDDVNWGGIRLVMMQFLDAYPEWSICEDDEDLCVLEKIK